MSMWDRALQLAFVPNEDAHYSSAKTQLSVTEHEAPYKLTAGDAEETIVAEFSKDREFIKNDTQLLVKEFRYTPQ